MNNPVYIYIYMNYLSNIDKSKYQRPFVVHEGAGFDL